MAHVDNADAFACRYRQYFIQMIADQGEEFRDAQTPQRRDKHLRAGHHITPNFSKASTVLMPFTMATRTWFSLLTFSSACRSASSSACRGTATTPSISPNRIVPGS